MSNLGATVLAFFSLKTSEDRRSKICASLTELSTFTTRIQSRILVSDVERNGALLSVSIVIWVMDLEGIGGDLALFRFRRLDYMGRTRVMDGEVE